MKPPFTDNVAIPLPGIPLTTVCPRAGVINPIAYNVVVADKSLVDAGISPGDDIYILSTADIENNELAAVRTPDGIFVRFVHWHADPAGKLQVRLDAANAQVAPMIYEYDDQQIRTRWRVVWICRHGNHSECFAFKSPLRAVC
jgi:hypothetical protein